MPGPARIPTVSVVVPTYRRRAGLAALIAPLLADPATTEIVVVVDGSPDGSLELLADLAVREPRLRPLWQENSGQAVARQVGVEAAAGEVVLVLDDDVIASPGLVGGHAARHASAGGLVVVGDTPNRPPPRRAGHAPTLMYTHDYDEVHEDWDRDPGSVFRRFWSGNFSLRRADALRVGLLTDGPLRYHEDQQFGFRCLAAGLTPVFDRLLTGDHHHERSLADLARECRRQGSARVELARRHPGLAGPADASAALPAVLRLAVRATRAPGVASVASSALLAAGRGAGRMGAAGAEMAAARLLRQVELDRGARDALAGRS